MTVPRASVFSDWIAKASESHNVWLEFPHGLEAVTREAAVSFLLTVKKRRDELAEELSALPAFVWLRGQRSYQRAFDLVHGRKRRGGKKDGQSIEEAADELVERLRDRPFPFACTSDIRGVVYPEGVVTFRNSWELGCMEALAEYLEATAGQRMMVAYRAIGPAASELKSALENYLAHADVIERLNLPRSSFRYLSRLRSYRETGFSVPHPESNPLGRLDARSSERLFVYRMWCANKRATRSPKTEAIAEMMGIEGFRHQYDTRTIERLCAGFTGKRERIYGKHLPGQ